jgi:hypothetical protein
MSIKPAASAAGFIHGAWPPKDQSEPRVFKVSQFHSASALVTFLMYGFSSKQPSHLAAKLLVFPTVFS